MANCDCCQVLASGDLVSVLSMEVAPPPLPAAAAWPQLKLLLRTAAPALLRPAPNYSWVEVLRQSHPNEGKNGYGCWFWLLLPPYPRGSGVFVNVGRSLTFSAPADALTALRPPGTPTDGRRCRR